MPRYRLTIAYDGTRFHGWQKQAGEGVEEQNAGALEVNPSEGAERAAGAELSDEALVGAAPALRTVQSVVERAVRLTVRERVRVLGASRTDSGVHARGQVAAFTCADDRRGPPEERLAEAMNARLPEDVMVTECARARDDFDPIGDCESKGYRYSLRVGRHRPLWDRWFVHHVREELDDGLMRAVAARLVGEHDFAAFAKAGHGRLSTVRRVLTCDVSRPRGDRIEIEVSGTGFLHNMVRIIAGTLVDAGKGKLSAAEVDEALRTGDRRMAGPTLPAGGLCLEWIRYGEGAKGPKDQMAK